MYLPLELNTPLLIGGLIAHYVSTEAKMETLNTARREEAGTIDRFRIIAGGRIDGRLSAL